MSAPKLRSLCERAIAAEQFGSWQQLARVCGYMRYDKPDIPDAQRLKRILGINARGKGATGVRVHLKTADRIVRALDLPPVDFDF